jgi:hypothetical protein
MNLRIACNFIGTILFSLSTVFAEGPPAQSPGLEALRTGYQTRKLEVQADGSQKVTELAGQYAIALDRLIEQKSGGGDLNAVIAIRAEKDALKDPLRLPLLQKAPLELERFRATFVANRDRLVQSTGQRVAELDTIYFESLSKLETQFTKDRKLDEALAVRAEKVGFEELLKKGRAVPGTPGSDQAPIASSSKIARLEADMAAAKGKSGFVTFQVSGGLPATVNDFPAFRKSFSNRDQFDVPKLPFEPEKGRIFCPEFRTKVGTLKVNVQGAALLIVLQGMRVSNTGQAEEVIDTWGKKGWAATYRSWTEEEGVSDVTFAVTKVAEDEVLDFKGLGGWEQLPTVIVGSLPNAMTTSELTK